MSPEFRRYLWIELAPRRIGIVLLILTAFFLPMMLVEAEPVTIAWVAMGLWFVMGMIWGTHKAANSVIQELRDGTWDGQRLSPMTPWSVTWGKLFGASLSVWVASILLVALIAYNTPFESGEAPASPRLHLVLTLFGSLVLAQALALMLSLQGLKRDRYPGRLSGTGHQVLALAFLSIPLSLSSSANFLGFATQLGSDAAPFQESVEGPMAYWYFWQFPLEWFWQGVLWLLVGWGVLGVWRLMRSELQMPGSPLPWGGFVVFLMILIGGFLPGIEYHLAREDWAGWNLTQGTELVPPFLIGALLHYGLLLTEPTDAVMMRRLRGALQAGSRRQLLEALPCWPLGLALTLMVGLATVILLASDTAFLHSSEGDIANAFVVEDIPNATAGAILSVMLFLLRDTALVLWLNLARGRHHLGLILLLFMLLYLIIPGILATGDLRAALVFWPSNDSLSLISGTLQFLAIASFAYVSLAQANAKVLRKG